MVHHQNSAVNELLIENEVRLSSSVPTEPRGTLSLANTTDISVSDTNLMLSNNPTTTEESNEDCSLTSISILMPPDDEETIDPFADINFNLSNHISNGDHEKDDIEEVIAHTKVEAICEKNPFKLHTKQLSEDTTSLSSLNSVSSHEINSVEEALRALDFAIEGEDISPEEPFNSLEYNAEDVLNVMVQEIKNEYLDLPQKHVPIDFDMPSIEEITHEAVLLVDDVLSKCQSIVENMVLQESIKEETPTKKEVFEFVKPLPPSQIRSHVKSQKSSDLEDELFESFSSQIANTTSTPSGAVSKKFSSYRISEETNQAVQKLNFGDDSSPNVANNNTFEVSSDYIVPGDATFDVPKSSSESPKNRISPPLIKIDRDDGANSDGSASLPGTATPVNTPNELNFPNETWNKIVAKNLMKNRPADADLDVVPLDITFDKPNDKTFGKEDSDVLEIKNDAGGWFLHPQIPKSSDLNDNTFDVAEDESLGDDNNRDRSIEALRMHLTATLSHAGSAMIQGPQDYSDDEDTSTALSDKYVFL